MALPSGTPRVPRGQPKTPLLVAESIAGQIAADGLRPGDRLPVEAEMLRRYEVGRASLREALRILEVQGVLEIRVGAGGGPFVASPQPQKVARVLSLMLRLSGVSFAEVMDARLVLAPALARQAALHRTPAQLAALWANQAELDATPRADPAFMAVNQEFHVLVAEAAHNRVLAAEWATLSTIADGSAAGVRYDTASRSAMVKAHRKIISEVEAGDGPAAEAAMTRHLTAAFDYVREHYGHLIDKPISVVSSV